ncbi:MAG: FixH family protein [Deltaproteobacteria bacterium]|nr:FixH family protein [Deltaproteobacteria bacterium]
MPCVIALPSAAPPPPWYRQFWPWFLIAVPGLSVVASLAMLVIAVRHADSLVRDDYYAAGLAIDRDFALERVAAQRHLVATLHDDDHRPELALELRGEGVDPHSELTLLLSHPTDAARDQTLRLRAGADGIFRAALAAPLRGPWNAALAPAGGGWRLAARIDFDAPTPPQLPGSAAGAPRQPVP